MGFLRSKSRGKGDDADQKRRNRLSKPLTNKSQTNLRAAAKQDSVNEEAVKSKSQLDLDQVILSPPKEDSRATARSHLFNLDTSVGTPKSEETQQVKSGVAQLVAQYEHGRPSPSSSQISLNSKINKRPMSAVVVSPYSPMVQSPRMGQMQAKSQYRFSPQTPQSAFDDHTGGQISDHHPIPARRRSNYIPGEATRKLSAEEAAEYPLPPQQRQMTSAADDESVSSRNEVYADANDSWTMPPHPACSRPETPRNIECTALGSLTLGSLRITNGRASPDISVVSTQVRQRQVSSRLRDVSSEYGDSEAWEDDVMADDQSEAPSTGRKTPTNGLQRNFSFIGGTEAQLTAQPETREPYPDTWNLPRTPIQKSPGATSVLAEEYIAELAASPFAEPVRGSSPTGSTGSVIHHDLNEEQDDFMSCAGNSAANSPVPRRRHVSDESHRSTDSNPSTLKSKISSVDSQFAQEDAFKSALEFQQYQPPPSPERPRAPFMTAELAKSDSGYSSNTSVRSIRALEEKQQHIPRDVQLERSVTTETVEVATPKASGPRKLGGFLPIRPMLKSRNTAPAASVVIESRPDTRQSLQSAPPLTQSESTTSSPLTPTKQRKRLQKLKTTPKGLSPKLTRLEEVIVQRNTSVESYSIPVVPAQALANLKMRAKQLPELERTVRNHTKQSSGSSSNLTVQQEIRFPTPNPEPEEDERESRTTKTRSKSRPRSKSRRRSMLEFFTGNKEEKRKSIAQQDHVEMTIDDLGDVVAALGSNPYDIAAPLGRANSRSNNRSGSYDPRLRPLSADMSTPRYLPPHRISHQNNPQKFMMDDQTASQYARRRSRSIHERDRWNERPSSPHPPPPPQLVSSSRRSSFNDRGGIPGKNLRSLSTSEDTPPLPPMPSPAEIRRMSGRYDGRYSTHQNRQEESGQWTSELSEEPEDTAPPPPPHSPRPSFVEEREREHEHSFEEPEDLSLAPPPPCHSPRPTDVPPEPIAMPENGWARHAREWRVRRQSAGEALRAQWDYNVDDYGDDNVYGNASAYGQNGNPYPMIPPRNRYTEYYDGSENWPSHGSSDQRWNTSYQYQPQVTQDGYEWSHAQYHYDDHSQHASNNFRQQPHNNYYEDVGYTPPRGRRPQLQQHDSYNSHHSRDSHHAYTGARPASRGPSPTPSSRPLPNRPNSRISHHSNNSAVSLADELHPERLERPSLAPAFGRYSGGLQYGYEGQGKGFGGSSGTRSVSGKADGQWKGMELKQSYGVDLGDVPIMGVVRPLR